MKLKSFRLDEETLNHITAIKKAKGLSSEKDVIVKAIEQYMLSEMIEHDSLEYKTLKRMEKLDENMKRLNNKLEYMDESLSINSLFLAADFEVNRYPKGIIDRDTFNGEYYKSAKKEIRKIIRNDNKKEEKKENSKVLNEDESTLDKKEETLLKDDSWLDV